MHGSKPVKVPIPIGVKLSVDQCPKTQEEEEDMSHVPYASAVSIMMCTMVCTRPDIAHAVGVLSRYMSKLGKEHWITIKRVFRYLCGTSQLWICATKEDQDWTECWIFMALLMKTRARDLDQRRSTSGYVFNLFGGAVGLMRKNRGL
jgi:hypothetical protein